MPVEKSLQLVMAAVVLSLSSTPPSAFQSCLPKFLRSPLLRSPLAQKIAPVLMNTFSRLQTRQFSLLPAPCCHGLMQRMQETPLMAARAFLASPPPRSTPLMSPLKVLLPLKLDLVRMARPLPPPATTPGPSRMPSLAPSSGSRSSRPPRVSPLQSDSRLSPLAITHAAAPPPPPSPSSGSTLLALRRGLIPAACLFLLSLASIAAPLSGPQLPTPSATVGQAQLPDHCMTWGWATPGSLITQTLFASAVGGIFTLSMGLRTRRTVFISSISALCAVYMVTLGLFMLFSSTTEDI